MMNFVVRFPALLCVLSNVTACAWSQARPTLVLQLSRIERATRTVDGPQQARELVLSASISMAVDRAELDSPATHLDVSEPSSFVSSAASFFDAALGCEQSPTLCAWAYSAEEAAVVAVLETHGAEL